MNGFRVKAPVFHHGRRQTRRPLLFHSHLALLAGVLAVSALGNGCLSRAEREGVSSVPVNRPANWETRHGRVEGDL